MAIRAAKAIDVDTAFMQHPAVGEFFAESSLEPTVVLKNFLTDWLAWYHEEEDHRDYSIFTDRAGLCFAFSRWLLNKVLGTTEVTKVLGSAKDEEAEDEQAEVAFIAYEAIGDLFDLLNNGIATPYPFAGEASSRPLHNMARVLWVKDTLENLSATTKITIHSVA